MQRHSSIGERGELDESVAVMVVVMTMYLQSLAALGLTACLLAQLNVLSKNKPMLDAHNCYPYNGRWADRIERALKTGFPVAIEQDLAWSVDPVTGAGRVMVSHTAKTKGTEPALRDYFFERVRPL